MKKTLISAIASLLLLLIACAPSESSFVNEYNSKVARYNELLQEHDKVVNDVNNNLNNLDLSTQKRKEYLEWVNKNRPEIIGFKSYVETNHDKLRVAGVNPDYMRDNLKTVLQLMQENELRFKTLLEVQRQLEDITKQIEAKVSEQPKEQEKGPCPDLPDINFNLAGDSPLMGGYMVVLKDYNKPVFQLEYTSPWTVAGGGVSAICHKGSQKGENANYVYCGESLYEIYLVSKDDRGNILNKRAVTLIFDSQTKQYVTTTCDGYPI